MKTPHIIAELQTISVAGANATAGLNQFGQGGLFQFRQCRAFLGRHPCLDVRSGDLEQQGQVAEGGPEGGRGRGDVRVGPQQGVPEKPLVVGRQLALDLAPGSCCGDPVELVKEAGNRVPFGIEVDDLVWARSEKEEPQLFGRQDLGNRVCGHTLALGRRHLLAADVQELVGDVSRRLHFEALAADRIGALARATGRS